MKLRVIAVFDGVVLAVFLPVAGALVCGALVVLQVALMCLRPLITQLPLPRVRPHAVVVPPVFSVHVATHAEPPAMVLATLRALLRQDWPQDRFEVVVMDNNTADPALWQPVSAFCAQHAGVTFLHRMGVAGAKAGALNIALDHSRKDTTHIVTVDADYIVAPNFLTAAAQALARTGADYVQFPQSYTGTLGRAAGVDAELEEYFRSNVVVADEAEAVLLTGTLCVISRNALVAAGGWSGETTTEDAEMGVRLCHAGFCGRFINQVVGRGYLPFSLPDLETQRYRWCSGNLQTFLHHFRTLFSGKGALTLHKRLVIVSQLTAWFNLSLVPVVVLLASLALGRGHALAAGLAATAICLSFLDLCLRITGLGLRRNFGVGVAGRALACRLALAPQSAKATFDGVLGQRLAFVVTDKSGGTSRATSLPLAHLLLFALALLALIAAQPAPLLISLALLILILPLPAAVLTDHSLRAYRSRVLAPMAQPPMTESI